MFYALLSPLAKIFQPEFTVTHREGGGIGFGKVKSYETVTARDLMADPERVFKEEEFSVKIYRSVGDLLFRYNVPRIFADPNVAVWLSGGDRGDLTEETNQFGIVKIPLDPELEGAMQFHVANNKEVKDRDVASALEEARSIAKKLSHDRVIRAIRKVRHCNIEQMKLDKEAGRGSYMPSPTEYLCAYVLSAEESKTAEERKRLTETYRSLMLDALGSPSL